MEFQEFPKIARWSRPIIITEKLDGTNASIYIEHITDTHGGVVNEVLGHKFFTGSRNRWITPDDDNHGFSRWAHENQDELLTLGPGHHFGEWWGQGIQRKYGLNEKRFSLFNVSRWTEETKPKICHVVPILFGGVDCHSHNIDLALNHLKEHGSAAAPGFMKPEGIVIFHAHANMMFKKTLEKDHEHKSQSKVT